MTNEVTVFYLDDNNQIGVTTMEENQAKKQRDVKFTAKDIVDQKIDSVLYALTNDLLTTKKRIEKLIELETGLIDFYSSVNELDVRDEINSSYMDVSISRITKHIDELSELKTKLISLKSK